MKKEKNKKNKKLSIICCRNKMKKKIVEWFSIMMLMTKIAEILLLKV